jgi:hypothetical protein
MICQNCRTEVDNDLVFCTACGARLHETVSNTQNDSVATQNIAPPPKSNLKWIALIVALMAIPASIFGVYLLLNRPPNVVQNVNKPATPVPSPTRKANTNQANNANANSNVNSNVNTANTNLNANQSDSEGNSETPQTTETVFWKERIEIAPSEHYAVPFEMEADGEISGTIKAVEGSPIEAYLYTQQQFDDHFPDPIYKAFSITGEKKAETKQKLLKENYVLVFVNNSESGLIIEGEFKIKN